MDFKEKVLAHIESRIDTLEEKMAVMIQNGQFHTEQYGNVLHRVSELNDLRDIVTKFI
jgi:hypothetical protein